MMSIYIFILFLFSSSYQYKVIDLEQYRYIYYVKDIIKTEDKIVIYKYQPESKEKEIFISFLGDSHYGNFEIYLYSNISEIKYDNKGSLINYIDKYDNYGEIKINQEFDIYYILIKMNFFEDVCEYFSFMMYNLKEGMDIGNYNDYMLSFEGDKNFTLNYPDKNFSQYLYIKAKGRCEYINYCIYKDNTEQELIDNKTIKCALPQSLNFDLEENNKYYIKISIKNKGYNIVRMVFYYLNNTKDIIEIKDSLTDIKYGYTAFKGINIYGPTYKYFFVNIENVPINGVISYSIYEPFISNNYKYSIKYYNDYNISKLPKGSEITDYYRTYPSYRDINIEKAPIIYIRKIVDCKGLIIEIENSINEDNEETMHYENIMYLYAKNLYFINENETFDYTRLLTKNAFYLSYNSDKYLLMKSNLEYFNLLDPKRSKIKSKNYLFNSNTENSPLVFEIPISENVLVELNFINKTNILDLVNPSLMFLCNNSIEEEKYIYLPYMTHFNILFGDIQVYDINITSLKGLDDLYNETYMEKYNNNKRNDDYPLNIEEKYFYKLKCKKYSLIKYENAFMSYIDNNLKIYSYTTKTFLDFSRSNKKLISFDSDLTISIGVLNSSELIKIENWTLNFIINYENYTINSQNDTFIKEVKKSDILLIEKPDNNIHVYIKVLPNYNIRKFEPLITNESGIFIFDKNISEEYNVEIRVYWPEYSENDKLYSLFYGNPKNFEYDQLLNNILIISNNLYKYLEEDDEDKYFFLVFNRPSSSNIYELRIMKLRDFYLPLKELCLTEKNNYENLKVTLPKINNEKIAAFFQYFNKDLPLYNNSQKLYYEKYGVDYRIYILEKYMEPYFKIDETEPNKNFFLISYMNYQDYKDLKNIEYNCNFNIKTIDDYLNHINITFDTLCSSTIYNYTIFIEYNNTNYSEPLEQYYEKDKNNNTKYYVFQKKGNDTFEISDTFKKGENIITIIGQDTEGFNRFVYERKTYNYEGEEKEKESKSNLTGIIIGAVAGGFVLLIIIIVIIVKHKNKLNTRLEDEKIKLLKNKCEENTDFKKYEESADFKKYEESADFKKLKECADFKKNEECADFKNYEDVGETKNIN